MCVRTELRKEEERWRGSLGEDVLITVVLPKRDRCQLTKITNTAIARRKQHSQALDARASCAEASSGINGHSRPWQTSFTCSE